MAASLALASGACTRPPASASTPTSTCPRPAAAACRLLRERLRARRLRASACWSARARAGRSRSKATRCIRPASARPTSFAQASVLELWDPDRSQVVRQRLRDGAARRRACTAARRRRPGRLRGGLAQRATRAARRRSGRGLRVLTPAFTSPTLARAAAGAAASASRARAGTAHAPLRRAPARAGARLAFGRDVRLVLHFDRARFVAGARLPIRSATGRAACATRATGRRSAPASAPAKRHARRRAALARDRDPRRACSARAPTSASRWRRTRIEALRRALAAQLVAGRVGRAGADPRRPRTQTRHSTARIVAALRARRRRRLSSPARTLSARAHALVAAINQRLGAVGRTLEPIAPPDAWRRAPATLAELRRGHERRQRRHAAGPRRQPGLRRAGALGVADALRRVPFSAHLGLHRDETARACAAGTCRASHDYESWSDALRARRQRDAHPAGDRAALRHALAARVAGLAGQRRRARRPRARAAPPGASTRRCWRRSSAPVQRRRPARLRHGPRRLLAARLRAAWSTAAPRRASA